MTRDDTERPILARIYAEWTSGDSPHQWPLEYNFPGNPKAEHTRNGSVQLLKDLNSFRKVFRPVPELST